MYLWPCLFQVTCMRIDTWFFEFQLGFKSNISYHIMSLCYFVNMYQGLWVQLEQRQHFHVMALHSVAHSSDKYVQISIIAKHLRCIDRQNCIWTSPRSYMARVNPHVQHTFTRVRSQGCRRRAQKYMMQLNVIGMQARCTCNWQQSDESNDHVYELLCITLFEIGFIKCHLLRPLVCMCLFATRATLQRKSNIFVENAMFVVHSSVPLRGHLHKMMTANIAQSADGASILSIQFCKFPKQSLDWGVLADVL